jgi:hypothetical protein
MKIRKPNTFGMQGIEIWRLDQGITMCTKITVALIVGHHQDYVRTERVCVSPDGTVATSKKRNEP